MLYVAIHSTTLSCILFVHCRHPSEFHLLSICPSIWGELLQQPTVNLCILCFCSSAVYSCTVFIFILFFNDLNVILQFATAAINSAVSTALNRSLEWTILFYLMATSASEIFIFFTNLNRAYLLCCILLVAAFSAIITETFCTFLKYVHQPFRFILYA